MSILRKRAKENVPWPKSAPFIAAALIILTYCITAFTGLRYTIPGYPSAKSRQEAVENMAKVDSLERVIEMWSEQISSIQCIVGGHNPVDIDTTTVTGENTKVDTTLSNSLVRKDSLLRETVRNLDKPVGKSKNGTDR